MTSFQLISLICTAVQISCTANTNGHQNLRPAGQPLALPICPVPAESRPKLFPMNSDQECAKPMPTAVNAPNSIQPKCDLLLSDDEMKLRNCYAYAMGVDTIPKSYDGYSKPQPGGLALSIKYFPAQPPKEVVDKLRRTPKTLKSIVAHVLDDSRAIKAAMKLDYEPVIYVGNFKGKELPFNEEDIPDGYMAVAVFTTQEKQTRFDPSTREYFVADYHLMKFNKETKTWHDKIQSSPSSRDRGIPFKRIGKTKQAVRQGPKHGQKLDGFHLEKVIKGLKKHPRLLQDVHQYGAKTNFVYKKECSILFVIDPGLRVQPSNAKLRDTTHFLAGTEC